MPPDDLGRQVIDMSVGKLRREFRGVPRNVRDQPADPGLDEPLPLFHKARDCFRDERLERRLMRDSPQGYCGGSPLPEAATRPPPGYANGGLHSMPPHERPENTRAKPVIGRPVPNCALAEQIVNRVQDRFGVQPRREMLLNPNDPGQLVLAFPLPDQVGGQVQFRLRRPVPKGAAGPPGRNDSGDLRCPDSPILDCVLQVPFEPVACRRIRCSFESVLKIQNQWGVPSAVPLFGIRGRGELRRRWLGLHGGGPRMLSAEPRFLPLIGHGDGNGAQGAEVRQNGFSRAGLINVRAHPGRHKVSLA